jgi:hypothetical protein
MHVALMTLVLVADRFLPEESRAREIQIAQVDIINAAEFDAAISQAPSVPDTVPDPAPGPGMPESRPPTVASDSARPPDARPAARPAEPQAPQARVEADTASDEPLEPVAAPRQPSAPRTAAPGPVRSEAPEDAPVASPPRPRGPSAPQPPDRIAAVDTTSPPQPPPAPEPAPEPAPAEEAAPETPAEPTVTEMPIEAPLPDPAPAVPADPLAAAPRAVVPVARPRDLAQRAPAPPLPEPARQAAADPEPQPAAPEPTIAEPNPIDALVEQAQRQATAPEGTGAGAPDLTRAQRGMLIRGIRQHFVPPEGIANAQSLAVTFLIELGRNGRITSSALVSPSGTLDPAHNALRLRAIQALVRANEEGLFGQLPQDSYETWRQMRVTFTPEDLLL